jgi:hypothetical protein
MPTGHAIARLNGGLRSNSMTDVEMRSSSNRDFLGKNADVDLHFAFSRASDSQKPPFSPAQVREIFLRAKE